MVPEQEIGSYRNRHGIISQKILVAYNFDLELIYVLSGWEGYPHDSNVLKNALSRNDDVATLEPSPTRLASPNRNSGTLS